MTTSEQNLEALNGSTPPAVPYPIAQQLDKALRALLTNTLESGRLNWTDVEPVEEAHAALSQMAEWRSKNITHP